MTTRRHTKRRYHRTHRPRRHRIDGLGWIILGMAAVMVVFLVLMP